MREKKKQVTELLYKDGLHNLPSRRLAFPPSSPSERNRAVGSEGSASLPLASTVIGIVLELNADTRADGIKNHLARNIHKVDIATPSRCPS